MIAIVDYGAGNLTSVCQAIRAVGGDPRLARRTDDLLGAGGVIVPGVGHFATTAALTAPWRNAINQHVAEGRPLLGVCLGMQWLFESSDEAPACVGLAWFEGRCARLQMSSDPRGGRLKVPHVGWNQLQRLRGSAALEGVPDQAFVYFTHTFAAPVTIDTVAASAHGVRFAAVVERGRVWGVQFHPEKSGEVGLRILGNFVGLARASAPEARRR